MTGREEQRRFLGWVLFSAVFVLIGLVVPVLIYYLPGGTLTLRKQNDQGLVSLRQHYRSRHPDRKGREPAGAQSLRTVQQQQQQLEAQLSKQLRDLIKSVGFSAKGATDEAALLAAVQQLNALARQAMGKRGGVFRDIPQTSPATIDSFLREIYVGLEIRCDARALARLLRLTQEPGSYFAVRQAKIEAPLGRSRDVVAELLLSALVFSGEN